MLEWVKITNDHDASFNLLKSYFWMNLPIKINNTQKIYFIACNSCIKSCFKLNMDNVNFSILRDLKLTLHQIIVNLITTLMKPHAPNLRKKEITCANRSKVALCVPSTDLLKLGKVKY